MALRRRRLARDPTVQFPNLFQVFGGYLNQDFDLDYESADDALRAAAAEDPDQVGRAIREIDTLLERDLTHEELEGTIERLTAGYAPELEGWDAREWLMHARTLLGGRA